jgi:hypothetical protein
VALELRTDVPAQHGLLQRLCPHCAASSLVGYDLSTNRNVQSSHNLTSFLPILTETLQGGGGFGAGIKEHSEPDQLALYLPTWHIY